MSKLPSFQFYPGDWRKNANLSRVSLEAKGAMIEVMCIAFGCERRGYLMTDKIPWTIDEIAMAIGGEFDKSKKAVIELIDKKVLKKNKKNTIFSARMVRDEAINNKRRKGGELGGSQGVKGKKFGKLGGRPVTRGDKKPPLKPPPSSSSSSSSSSSIAKKQLSSKQVFEFLRTATDPKFISDRQLEKEVETFIKKYEATKIINLKALCNTWASNLIPENKKEMVL